MARPMARVPQARNDWQVSSPAPRPVFPPTAAPQPAAAPPSEPEPVAAPAPVPVPVPRQGAWRRFVTWWRGY